MLWTPQLLLLALIGERTRAFFRTIGEKWLDDLQNFIHESLPKIVVILIFAWVATRVLKLITSRVLRITERRAGPGDGHLAQVRTLTSVIRATGIGIIFFLAALEILPMLGFKLEPLIASAGVAGVAIGLAAQTIVKDCLNGVLILVEDQYNVGDVVKLAGLGGKVEAMTLRRTMVRADDGTLYIIPNSQITTVANQTRDFSVATINVSVDYSAHPDEVMKLLKDVAMGVRNDEQFKDVFLADPTLLGVDSVKGSQVIYPVQLKTRANQQWAAEREMQRRIRIALEENHLLPGDPMRVWGGRGGQPVIPPPQQDGGATTADPTAAKPHETNPFEPS